MPTSIDAGREHLALRHQRAAAHDRALPDHRPVHDRRADPDQTVVADGRAVDRRAVRDRAELADRGRARRSRRGSSRSPARWCMRPMRTSCASARITALRPERRVLGDRDPAVDLHARARSKTLSWIDCMRASLARSSLGDGRPASDSDAEPMAPNNPKRVARSRSSAPPARSARCCCACSRQREFPVARAAPARERALGRHDGALPREGRCRSSWRGPRPSTASTSCSSPRPASSSKDARPRGRQARRHRDRQVEHLAHGPADVPLVVPGDQRRGGREAQGHHRQPELHDDAVRDGARSRCASWRS